MDSVVSCLFGRSERATSTKPRDNGYGKGGAERAME